MFIPLWRQLQAIKSSRGATADDGSVTVLKPLVEVLREAKERKEAEFQGKWKQMKQGLRSCQCCQYI